MTTLLRRSLIAATALTAVGAAVLAPTAFAGDHKSDPKSDHQPAGLRAIGLVAGDMLYGVGDEGGIYTAPRSASTSTRRPTPCGWSATRARTSASPSPPPAPRPSPTPR